MVKQLGWLAAHPALAAVVRPARGELLTRGVPRCASLPYPPPLLPCCAPLVPRRRSTRLDAALQPPGCQDFPAACLPALVRAVLDAPADQWRDPARLARARTHASAIATKPQGPLRPRIPAIPAQPLQHAPRQRTGRDMGITPHAPSISVNPKDAAYPPVGVSHPLA